MVQTLKVGRAASGGLHRVCELEAILPDGAGPDLSAIPDRAMRDRVSACVGKAQLRAVFETRVTRHAGLLATGAGTVEVALDAGEIDSRGVQQPVSEVEFEVRTGGGAAAYRAAAALLGDMPARLHDDSKAERGFRLADGLAGEMGNGAAGALRTGTVPEAASDWALDRVEAALRAYSEALAQNIHCVMVSADPEGPHQVRVAARRLRALLWLAEPVFAPDWRKATARTCKALGRAVAPARDADVFIDEIVAPALGAGEAGDAELMAALEAWRAATHDQVRGRLRAMTATGLALGLLEAVSTRAWAQRTGQGGTALVQPLAKIAAPALAAEWDRLERVGRKLGRLPVEDRHDLRKALKRLRYGAEIAAAGLAETAGGADFLKALRRVQTALGKLNDLDTIAPMRPALGDAGLEARLEACLAGTARDTGDAKASGKSGRKARRRLLEKAEAQWAALAAAPRFWAAGEA